MAPIPPAGPIASTASFALQTSYQSFTASGYTKAFTISGTCTGSGNGGVSAANTPAVFEGVSRLSSTTTLTETLTNCTPASFAQSGTTYYDTNYAPVGHSTAGVSYGIYLTPPNVPVSVRVGDTGSVGTEARYTDSAKTTPSGSTVTSYIIEADTANTAIVNLISKTYNATGILTSTEQDRYRITSSNTLTPTSMDVQYANGSTTHLLLTFN